MTMSELFNHVLESGNLKGVGIEDTDKGTMLLIECADMNKLVTRIPAACVEKLSWEELYPILTGVREPVTLQHMTRVVGYYSRIENWNQSKVGELSDRHKGTYSVQEVACA